ncbi:toll-like receptor 7 isoform a precursor [Mus musculus]|uniref:Toll-like receptor 7 n=3 Tax=Mus musculus TaxID=10090 RepID=TLR7_MOUSE|nr:toll-like receptor 7 isoform a precursor [Mus musculus]NP_001277685.1 toll-like receptor 7 isoform a precursor [Mus musculus]NP_001277686.1 toll-like receptor 7 isoform a precursor [Mus musculus]NP_573474.1 toll-like receptor 7 isoform a precursor [Mus musculus]P58681.1 RecName: Full=Toll-like receptor 7; Flags: Precursor [Mus musculus]AAI20597.1 Toll-like receptor 7 [Mus musculus]AAI32386.1 Tlr7 protein [Mus musculus]AAK62676.1 toll-like receptor 7 [Mus musculus]AAL73191.1 toll-like rec|eukprot:NP_001277684.1 toll-like receptor 7 isoform a precursor [Mus musculus]
MVFSMWTRKRQILIFLNMLLVSRVFGFRWFPKTLPCEVKVNIPEAHVIVDCTDKHLTEIPEGIPTNTTNLTLTINHIPSISPDSFRRLNHLEEIDLRCNCVPVLLGSKANVCTKRLQIRPGSFSGLSDLKALYLDGNQLLEIPQDLPSSLHLLSLEANNIFSITKENLTELVNIETLYLGQNCYYRNPCNVSYSIEKDAFLVMRNLKVLSLKDNNVTAVPTTLPPNLLELYLYNNIIKKIQENDFNNLNELQVLDLSGNCPRCYNVPYPCTPCENNSPLQIHDNAFNSLTELKVLRLHSNSLQHVPPTWFKNMRNLQELDLSQNYLAREIEEAKFLHFLPNLVELDFSFNYELQVYHASITLPHSLSSLENLKILRVKGYVFKELKNSSLSVLHKLPRLEVLDLGTNFIKIADLNIFKHFENLKLIDLSVNKISPSEESREVGFCPNAQTSVDRHGPQVLEALHYFRYDEYARSCRFKNKEPPSFLPLNADCHIYGQTLDLSRNNIFFIKPSDFQHLSFLKCLNLSGNTIGQTLNGSELWPLRELRYLDFSNNRLDLLYSTAFEELQSLEVLDLSSNSHYFQAEGITHMLNFTKKLRLLDKLMMNDNDISTSASRTMESDSLRILEFRGNHLDVLWRAGDNRYLDFFKNLFNLEVLDISRNSLNSLPPEVFEGMPPNLKNLSLAKNGLKSFFWDRLQLLKHLEILDLSHNQLTKVPERLANCSKSLTTLILKHNQIRQLTKYFLEDALQLRYLDISSNKIQVIQKTSFPENVLNNLEMLVLHHNRFLCNCDAVWFVWWVNHTDVTIPYLATDVTCVGPGAHKGQSVISLDLYTCELDLTNLILFSVSISSVLFLMVVMTTSHLFFWDMWYIYYFWKAKIKGYQHLQSMESCYDAFIVYDTKNSAVTEWVLQELVAKLEDPREKHFNLCLEERDWLPGQPVLENLSQSIQLSKKTVFVMTQKYAKTESFKMAFYLSHQRLLDEKVDVIILIFLEKPLQKSKFLQLRKRLCRSSVLEWPANPQAHPYFWQCLKNALTTDNHVAYSQMFKETV